MKALMLLAMLTVAGSSGAGAAAAPAAVAPVTPGATADSAAADSLEEEAGADTSAGEVEAPATVAHPSTKPAAPADTSLRVPGCWLRFGWTVARTQTVMALAVAHGGSRAEVVREGTLNWYGVESEVTLHFRGGALSRLNVAIKRPSPNARDYIEDTLLREGYLRTCTQRDKQAHICTWTGRAKIELRNFPERIDAVITPAPRVAAAPREVPLFGETLVYGRPPAAGAVAAPAVAFKPAPVLPPAARAAGVQGNVWVRALMDTSGMVSEVSIVRGIAELDTAALTAARQWRFERFAPGGVPHRARIEYPVRFLLR